MLDVGKLHWLIDMIKSHGPGCGSPLGNSLCVLVVGCSCSVFATDYQFPSGGGDLADLSKWQESYPGMAALPSSSDAVKLGSSSTYTMSADMTVGSFTFNSKDAILDFAASGNHTLKVMNSQSAFCGYGGTIKGGVIDRNAQAFFWFQANDREMETVEGCVLTNASSFCVNVWGTSNGKLHLKGASKIYATSLTVNSGLASTTSGGSLLDVSDGSKVVTTGDWNYSDATAKDDASGANALVITDEGSSVTMSGRYINGYHTHGNVLKVSDNGVFSAKALNVGYLDGQHYSNSNKLIVVGGTVKVTGGNLACYGDGSVIAVTNGIVDFKDKSYSYSGSGSVNTRIDIVNSTWRCNGFAVGKAVDLNVSGASTVFESSEKFFGLGQNQASGTHICFDDEFNWRPDIGYGYYFMEDSTNCSLTVRNAATFSAWHPANSDYDKIVFCGSSADHYGSGNAINAFSGGVIRGDSVQLSGRNNVLVVSNGVVSGSSSIQIGPVSWSSNNTVLVQGRTPRILSGGNFYLWNHSTLRVEVPAEGYAADHVPITANAFYLHEGNCKFEIDISRFLPKDRAELTLMSFDTDLTSEQQAFLLAAELPPRYSLLVVGNRDLVLKAKGEKKGFMLIFR